MCKIKTIKTEDQIEMQAKSCYYTRHKEYARNRKFTGGKKLPFKNAGISEVGVL